jgi:DNA-binding transcriptional LysR family regulator
MGLTACRSAHTGDKAAPMSRTPDQKDLDLSLLRCLEVLVSEAHVSRAAERLDMSQPAMSRALNRLREMFGDPLLVRSAAAMAPTARALELAQSARRILNEVNEVLSPALAFDPAHAAMSFRMIATDYIHAVFVPRLVAHLELEAPHVTLSLKHPAHPKTLAVWLEEGEIDLAIGHLNEPPQNLRSVALFREQVTCLVRSSHPCLAQPLTLDGFAQLRHILVTPGGYGHFVELVDKALAEQGLKRRVGMLSQHFMAAPYIAAESDMAVLMPARLARLYTRQLPLREIEMPLRVPDYDVSMYWHDRNHKSPAHVWLREAVKSLATGL